MADERPDDEPLWPPAMFARQFQEAGEQAMERQRELYQQLLGGGSGVEGFSQLDALSRGMATFKTRVQSGGRVSIPDAEREALGIEEGDIVQTVVIPVKKRSDTDE